MYNIGQNQNWICNTCIYTVNKKVKGSMRKYSVHKFCDITG